IRTSDIEDDPGTRLRERAQAKMINDSNGIFRGGCGCGLCSIEALDRVAGSLVSPPQQRKGVLYISNGGAVAPLGAIDPVATAFSYDEQNAQCNIVRHDAMQHVFRQAQLANVTIESIDPKGVAVGQIGSLNGADGSVDMSSNAAPLRLQFLQTM